ncbi:chromosome segregation protein SMC [Azohydromonas australica]|uniref:chromosome segregation protein SMC n=1 Tax=Azohydromonas australica TaxID=364039 RepID=UPI0004108CB8|nr:chromosome segregation protein SMC [Azohydromonas australica]
MRLNQIKLSGFKSFAEPTTFQLPGQLVGVVGPNGCGKSNIMDAVRWVLGESKASELRGESMQDVIFNGSGNRKPASRSSVELVFDNSSARAGGPWSRYSEIAVKRVLTRDGTSSYYINNQPVRRRDVQDVFLGTGLGPRAYAIIGQGTISRIIESKPEELRLFLEEAAGVSKYKERRRETELRLRDTRENLLRVEDILRELDSNLVKLEKQAEVAQRYKLLQEQGTLKLHQLWFLKHRDASTEEARVKAAIAEAQGVLAQRMEELAQVEAELEEVKGAHFAASDALHVEQGKLSDAALEVSRLEERIRYVAEGRDRAQQRLAELRAQDAQWAQRREQAAEELELIAEKIAAAEEQAELLAAQSEEQAERLPEAEEAQRQAAGRVAAQHQRVAQVQQQLQLLAADGRHLQEQQRQLNTRRERLHGEGKALQAPDPDHLAELQQQSEDAAAAQAQAEEQLHALSEDLPQLDAARRQAQEALNAETARQAQVTARLQALRALQEKVQTEGKLKPWLAKHGLEGLQGLWKQLHIEPGWETALESALRERLSALPVGRLDTVRAFERDAPPAKLAFYHAPDAEIPVTHRTLPRLADLLRLGDRKLQALLDDWLEGIYTAASLEEALKSREALTHGEWIVTREGHAVSQFAVSFYAPDSEQAGLLQRAQEIEQLQEKQAEAARVVEEAQHALRRAESVYGEAAAQLGTLRRTAAEAQTQAHKLHVEWFKLHQQAQAAAGRRAQLQDELQEIDAQLEALAARQAEDEAKFEELDLQLAQLQEDEAVAQESAAEAERRVAQAREQLRALERRAQEAQFETRSLGARRGELQRALETAARQLQDNAQAASQVAIELAAFDDAAAQEGLTQALALRREREAALAAQRRNYDELSLRMRQVDERRLMVERSLQPLREQITRLQLEQQAATLGGAQYLEQLTNAHADMAAIERSIEAGQVKLWGLQGEIDRIQREITSLGAVNLAALEELGEARERKGFLDKQNADLLDAINTLEDAIRRIDLETRELLSSTFDRVNDGFGTMFPSLFGGGQARLVMTGSEILDAGVQVMAQPPGKKNSTIHLLSGGEKALTAIALVFAIFQLNPAPFCLLDEVDAPLDDANTERYARLVTKMSQATQFLFISHNKIAMEMAQQLVGVTMQEQGVSRIVAVDMEAALGMAETA